MTTSIQDMFTSTEAAVYLGITDSLVRKYCRRGELKADRFGRNWVMTKRELDRFKKIPRPVGNPNFRNAS